MVAQAGGGKTLLDVGGGIGALSIELLTAGFEHATLVEAAPAYSAAARREADRRGQAERMTMLQGDFATIGRTIPTADVVVMDRVVCCYPEFQPLLEEALQHSRGLFAFSYPRDIWYIKWLAALQNAMRTFRHNAFHFMIHPAAAMEAMAARQGFRRVRERATFVWSVELYARKDADLPP
jgi:magnesium-protoporphyrin O-methyltransferase